jgi:hypothetical protein
MTTRLSCTEVESHLPLFVGPVGEDLETPVAERVKTHLEGCSACAGRLEALEDARGALLTLSAASGQNEDVDLWPGIRGQLAEEGLLELAATGPDTAGREVDELKPVAPRRSPILRFAIPFAGAAAAAVLAMLAWNPTTTLDAVPAGDPLEAVGGGEVLLSLDDSTTPHLLPVANRLRPADYDSETLRAHSRPFPTDGRSGGALRSSGGAGLSVVSDERLR